MANCKTLYLTDLIWSPRFTWKGRLKRLVTPVDHATAILNLTQDGLRNTRFVARVKFQLHKPSASQKGSHKAIRSELSHIQDRHDLQTGDASQCHDTSICNWTTRYVYLQTTRAAQVNAATATNPCFRTKNQVTCLRNRECSARPINPASLMQVFLMSRTASWLHPMATAVKPTEEIEGQPRISSVLRRRHWAKDFNEVSEILSL